MRDLHSINVLARKQYSMGVVMVDLSPPANGAITSRIRASDSVECLLQGGIAADGPAWRQRASLCSIRESVPTNVDFPEPVLTRFRPLINLFIPGLLDDSLLVQRIRRMRSTFSGGRVRNAPSYEFSPFFMKLNPRSQLLH